MAEYLEAATEAARLAGTHQREQFGTLHGHEYKSPGDPVSAVDHESERLIIEHLTARFPGCAILSEERGGVGDGEERWIVDPLDGTSNYVRGHPAFSVSIALEIAGELRVGVVYVPMRDDLYAVSRDSEGFDDGPAIGVSETDRLDSALVAIPYSSSGTDRDDLWATHRTLGSAVEGLRSTGSGALDLAYLAAGITDAACGFGQSRWDRAAGLVLVEAAGGQVTDHEGRADHDGDFVASNGLLHGDVLDDIGPGPV
ncbi:inositol monophosphatase [Halobacteriales archaeon QS_4_69_34]|nr:MAG: inositol monophosphatase [Halobacteriales archaeon QS_4_69_34]